MVTAEASNMLYNVQDNIESIASYIDLLQESAESAQKKALSVAGCLNPNDGQRAREYLKAVAEGCDGESTSLRTIDLMPNL